MLIEKGDAINIHSPNLSGWEKISKNYEKISEIRIYIYMYLGTYFCFEETCNVTGAWTENYYSKYLFTINHMYNWYHIFIFSPTTICLDKQLRKFYCSVNNTYCTYPIKIFYHVMKLKAQIFPRHALDFCCTIIIKNYQE